MRRDDFPIFEKHPELIYLDTAATAQKPRQVIERLHSFLSEDYGTVHRGVYALSQEATTAYEKVRCQVQSFLNAKHPEEIVFTRGTTAALNLVARAFPFERGDVVVLTEIEHHSNLIPWQMLGVELRFLPVNDRGELILEEAEKLIDERVKLVSLAHVSNVLGTIHPVEKIIRLAHNVGAKVCLDGAQAAGHLPIDVQKLDVDFYAFSGHKIYGPTGIGVLYGKKGLLEKMDPIEGGGDMIETVTLDQSTYAPLPLKFEAGTPPIAEVMGLGAALDYLTTLDLEKIQAHEHTLLERATTALSQINEIKILGTAFHKGPLISFTHSELHPLDLTSLLDCRHIAIRSGHQCSQPTMTRFGLTSVCRLSFGVYNTTDEVDEFIRALHDVAAIH